MIELDPNRYHTPIEPGDNDARSLVIRLTGGNRNVLEVGTSTGYMSEIFKRLGNSVTGIEKDGNAGEAARPHCDTLIIGDIEALDLDACLASYDVIVLADVLEHLVDPWKALKGMRSHIKKDGYLVVSIPNVCHGDVLVSMLRGNFEYMPTGLLDITHLRFFAYRNIVELFRGCGYEIAELHSVKKAVGVTEFATTEAAPDALLRFIKSLPHSDTYQFVFKAYPREGAADGTIIKAPVAGDMAAKTPMDALFAMALDESMKDHALQLVELGEKCHRQERDLAATHRNLVAFQNELIAFQREFEALQNSAGCRLERAYCDVLERWLPAGTSRRRAYARLTKGLGGLASKGPAGR